MAISYEQVMGLFFGSSVLFCSKSFFWVRYKAPSPQARVEPQTAYSSVTVGAMIPLP